MEKSYVKSILIKSSHEIVCVALISQHLVHSVGITDTLKFEDKVHLSIILFQNNDVCLEKYLKKRHIILGQCSVLKVCL